MGKNQHSKEKMYLTATEWKTEWGGAKPAENAPFKRLPFHCCALSFSPFENPVCTADGAVFEIMHIVPYVQKFHKNPVSGEPLELGALIQLKFHKNAEGQYHCPVLNKVFTDHSHIVAIKTSGNVYCYEAVEELNLKPRSFTDLLTSEPFTRKDVIVLQDPLKLQARSLQAFDHVKRELTAVPADATPPVNVLSDDMRRTMAAIASPEARAAAFAAGGGGVKAQLDRVAAAAAVSASGNGQPTVAPKPVYATAAAPADAPVKFKPGTSTWDTSEGGQAKAIAGGAPAGGATPATDAGPALTLATRGVYHAPSQYTSGACSRSFTSTTCAPAVSNVHNVVALHKTPKKKGYCSLHTNLGVLNLELHCESAPRTCENFLALCEAGRYDGTRFHRSIVNFMIQGGDPTGTGKGGESIWGGKFKDEFDQHLTHSGRGVLAMANSGKDSNGSQFFILYKSARHLDRKHTVFGRVVGGLDVLDRMESVPTDDEDAPTVPIVIERTAIFVNPYADDDPDAAAAAAKVVAPLMRGQVGTRAERAEAEAAEVARHAPAEEPARWYSDPGRAVRGEIMELRQGATVGKYLPPAATKLKGPGAPSIDSSLLEEAPPTKKTKIVSGGYGNFSAF